MRRRCASGEIEIGTGRDAASDSGERRALRIDGAPAKSQAELAEHFGMVWLTPQMDRLFIEGAGARAAASSTAWSGFDPGHAARLSAYEQAMRERARLLRDGPGNGSRTWLAALEETMAGERRRRGGGAARRGGPARPRLRVPPQGPFPRAAWR